MASSEVLTFRDPFCHQKAIRGAEAEFTVTGPGDYYAERTRVDLHDLWLQRSETSLPHVSRHALTNGRSVVFFLSDLSQQPIKYMGKEFASGDIRFDSIGAEHHHQVHSKSCWSAMSLGPAELAAAGTALLGAELVAPKISKVIRPQQHLMERLLRLHRATTHLAAETPDILVIPEVAKAMEQALLGAMVACLANGERAVVDRQPRTSIIRRFERALEDAGDNPVYLPEVCAAVGVSDRTLRLHCQEQLGMSPHRYLLVRRLNLARRELARADPASMTVTEVATKFGFWELGRFSAAFYRLFGEHPSTTLRRN
jgi:AraC-like DNA-binding protein